MQEADSTTLSVVIPAYNEDGSVARLVNEVRSALGTLTRWRLLEIIVVNDGSTDGTLAALRGIPGLIVIDLRRNWGQATALDAGFKYASGQVVVSLDGDGQNDPADIPRLLAAMRESGLDVVAGWRIPRRDPANMRVITRAARALRQLFIADSVHDSGCTLRVYRAEAVRSLDIGGEMHRYILALLRWKGFSIGEVPVSHRPRVSGTSKYGSDKAVRGFIDLIYVWFIHKYSDRPLHFFGYLSFTSFVLGAASAGWTLYNYFALGIHFARDVWVAVSFFFFLFGILFFCFGVVIDLLIRIQLTTSPHEKRYYIREIIKT